VRVTGAEAVLDVLRKLGLARFIREKEEVNKEAILNEPEAVSHVPGISISQGEDFVVVPFEAELAAVA
jgi:phage host-nuclease inhibitor protein Gam